MSFSTDVKLELAELKENEKNGQIVFIGIAYSVRHTSARGIGLKSETRELLVLFKSMLKRELGISAEIKVGRGKNPVYSLFFNLDEDSDESLTNMLNSINLKSLEDEAYESAWVRGSFLACGYIVDPKKSYHLEFLYDTQEKAEFIIELLSEYGFDIKYIFRNKGEHAAYLKDSSQIEDLLTFMGAIKSSMSLMDIKITKDIRNQINRQTNFDTANIEKAAVAGAEQSFFIAKVLAFYGDDEDLSADLRQVGELRIKNPSLSLEELAKLTNPPLSRSAVFRRIEKLKALSIAIEGKGGGKK